MTFKMISEKDLEWAIAGLRIEPIGRYWTPKETAKRIFEIVEQEKSREDSVLVVEEIECPCCGDWFTPCNDVEHSRNGMCAFCTLGQHDLTNPCRPGA